MSSVKHCQKNRDGRPDKPRKTTFEMHSGKHGRPQQNITQQEKTGLFNIGALQCDCAGRDWKQTVVHSSKTRERRLSHLLSRSPTMLEGRLRILVGLMCTFDPQQSEDKVQMTPAQRRTRFRCLRRSRRRLKKTFAGRSQQNLNPRTKPTQFSGLAKNFVRQKSETTQTLAQHCEWKRIAKQTQHSPFEITLPRVRNTHFSVRTDADAERWNILQTTPNISPSQRKRIFYKHFLLTMLTIHRAHPSKTTQHRLGKCSETHTNSKRHRKDNNLNATPRAQTSTRWHFLRTTAMTVQTSVSTFTEKRNA